MLTVGCSADSPDRTATNVLGVEFDMASPGSRASPSWPGDATGVDHGQIEGWSETVVEADPTPLHGRPYSIRLRIPPLGALWLVIAYLGSLAVMLVTVKGVTRPIRLTAEHFGVTIKVRIAVAGTREPVGTRNPAILYGLGNLLENAVDFARERVDVAASWSGKDVAVTAGEFDILKIFAENPNRPLSRDWLLETTSHRARDPFDRAIDLRITRIRRKIEPSPEKPTVIRTVRGVGYMFVPPAE